jgi:hypothetical protein
MTEAQLIRKAVRLFPIRPETPIGPVRHARREWVRKVQLLQENPPKAPLWRHIVIFN